MRAHHFSCRSGHPSLHFQWRLQTKADGGFAIKRNTDKIDDYTLALLYLVTWEREEGFGARAWKGFDFDTMDRLHEKGHISDPKGKAKSVVLTEDGFKKSEELFQEFFVEDQ